MKGSQLLHGKAGENLTQMIKFLHTLASENWLSLRGGVSKKSSYPLHGEADEDYTEMVSPP